MAQKASDFEPFAPVAPAHTHGTSDPHALPSTPLLSMDLLFDEVDSLLVFLAGAEHLEPQLSVATGAPGPVVASLAAPVTAALVEQVHSLTSMVAAFEPPSLHP